MPKDSIGDRYSRKQKDQKLHDLARKGMTPEEIEAEKELLEKTKKVDPIKADKEPDRNAPCPCGSGKKYKKCCGAK